jgi:hypothetical protein
VTKAPPSDEGPAGVPAPRGLRENRTGDGGECQLGAPGWWVDGVWYAGVGAGRCVAGVRKVGDAGASAGVAGSAARAWKSCSGSGNGLSNGSPLDLVLGGARLGGQGTAQGIQGSTRPVSERYKQQATEPCCRGFLSLAAACQRCK